jgi:flagellar biosynthesis chaperone FliJ
MRKVLFLAISLLFVVLVDPSLYAGPSEDHISRRITEIQHRIDEGVRAGTLTPDENKTLQSRLDKVRERFEKAKDKKYGLSDGEVASINKQLDTLNKDVSKERHDLQTTRTEDQITHRMSEMQKRIDTGNRDGSLTGSEAKSLQARLDGIRDHFDRAKKGGLSEQEIKTVKNKLDALEKEIYKQRQDSQRAR